MKFSILFVFVLSIQITLIVVSDAKRLQKRWTEDDQWPQMAHSFTKMGEDMMKRTNSMRDWILNQQKSVLSNFRPIMDLSESIENKNPEEFDPSVVIVDKGEQEHEEVPNPFKSEFPFQIGFQRPNYWSFGDMFAAPKPWWKGPNVCTERKVIEGKDTTNKDKNGTSVEIKDKQVSMNMRFQSTFGQAHSFQHFMTLQSTHCSESETSYTCVSSIIKGNENKTTITKHQCCHGFRRDGNSACTQVDLKDLVQTMKDLKSNRMMNLIERLGFYEKLVKDNITVFGLTDESLIEYEDNNNKIENEVDLQAPEVIQFPSAVRKRRELDNNLMKDVIGMHLIHGFVTSGDFEDETMVSTLSPLKIRINVYNNPKRVVTANCAPIISTNNYAVNGVVHLMDRVMQNPNQTVAEMIESDNRFTILRRLLANTDLMNKLRDNSQHMTVFAPTDSAFSRLDKLYLERLYKGQSCVEPLLNNHIIGNTICSSAVQEYASVMNAINVMLPIKRIDEKLEINGIRIVESDKLGTNGVIHVIDGVMFSEKSQPISKFIEKHQMTEFLDLVKDSGLLDEWDLLTNVSFFIPSGYSIRNLPQNTVQEIKNKTKQMFGYHVITPKGNTYEWNNNQMLNTMIDNKIRINTFEDLSGFGFIRPVTKTAQCAKVIVSNEQICGANIHIVDRFIQPSKGNLIQTLDSAPNLSVFRQIIKNSGIESTLTEGTYTLLAVNDQTLHNEFSDNDIKSLVSNQTESKIFIQNHLLPEIICCSGVNTSPLFLSSQQFQNMEGLLVPAHKSFNGRVRFGNSGVTKCDIMADNAVIHIVNRPLVTKPSIVPDLSFPFQFIF